MKNKRVNIIMNNNIGGFAKKEAKNIRLKIGYFDKCTGVAYNHMWDAAGSMHTWHGT
jgi:hypothetical protein